MILVDTSILIDIVTKDIQWEANSSRAIETAAALDRLAINDVVYAELAAGFDHLAQLETVLAHLALDIAPIPRPGLFLAGKAYRDYRRRGGVRTGVLPDFFIGAHAAVEGAQLLTRVAARIRTYFPTVSLLTPHPL